MTDGEGGTGGETTAGRGRTGPAGGNGGTGEPGLCLLLGRPVVWSWLYDALETVERETDTSVDLVVRTDTGGRPAETRLDLPFDATETYSAVEPVDGGPAVRLPDATVDRIVEETDVVFHNGVGILSGRILTEPEHGVLSYHHGDIRRYRGVLTHLWNYLNGDEVGGVTVLRLTEELDVGGIVAAAEVDLSNCLTWSEVETRKQLAGVPLLARAVENATDPDFEPDVPDPDELGRMYRSSDVTLPVIARYLLRETVLTTRKRALNLRKLLGIYRE
jgi:hypothetical protein